MTDSFSRRTNFYSRPCGRGDSIPAHWCVFEIISTHAPAGGATRSTRASRQSRRNFYSRPCGRGDTPSASLWRPPSYFYSRPCGRGDDVEGSAANTAGVFLLTPLREGRHTAAAPVNPTSCISTHAPAGGATRGTSCPCLSLCNFYSRPCGRGDLRDFPVFHVGIAISTHAPAGGATIGPHSFRKVYAVISTHAPAGGATPVSHTEGEAIALFLLTPLREGRLELDVLALCLVDFYSRPCGRGDFSQSPVGPPGVISTHAPAGGATKPYFLINLIFSLFLLTPLREGRPAAGRDRKKNGRDFYSRPCGRGDRGRSKSRRKGIDFYSRPCGRGDETIDALGQVKNEFLLTPLREGRRTLH